VLKEEDRMSKKRIIVTTTINPPTEALHKFDAMKDWTLVVAGDQRTPADFRLKNGVYLSPHEQEKYHKKFSDLIGWNTIRRRNFGFLIAKDMQADVVATVDDDNIPLDDWGQNVFVGEQIEVNYYETSLPCFDPVGATNYPQLWHRGFPLQLLTERDYSQRTRKKVRVDVQADFWNGDPDIDAVCRLEHRPWCQFAPDSFPLAANKPAPFNSQNTFLRGDILQDYFMVPFVGRMDDIWGAYHLQSCGYQVVFNKATVEQQRNPQDLTKNLKDEFLGYEKTIALVKAMADGRYSPQEYWPEQSVKAFQCYQECFS
jgi:hypothetical protein